MCGKCKIYKNASDFCINKALKDGLNYMCKECSKTYYKENKVRFEATRLRTKEYQRKYNSLYRKNNKEALAVYRAIYGVTYMSTYVKKRMKEDIQFKLSFLLRGRLRDALKSNAKKGSAVRDLGCTIQELKQYLEAKFKPGMTWDNWSLKGWHIDHIIPISAFDLTDREQLLKACHYTNLQPLWAKDNLRKGNRIWLK